MDEHIYIVPAGQIESKVLEYLKNELPDSLLINVKIEINQRIDMPQAVYDSSRKQYDARIVLEDISRHAHINTVDERMLVIANMDLYVPDAEFVFGLADNKGICIISLARLKNEFYGYKRDDKLFFDRVLKEAVHELGHSRGLDNCTNSKCVMYSSNSIADIDKTKNRFCHACKAKLLRSYGSPLFKWSVKPII